MSPGSGGTMGKRGSGLGQARSFRFERRGESSSPKGNFSEKKQSECVLTSGYCVNIEARKVET